MDGRWDALFGRLGVRCDVRPEFAALTRAYRESFRAYHNLEHIEACLGELDGTPAAAGLERDAIEIAIWYHDAVYDTRRGDNEAKSAEWARRDLERFEIRAPVRAKIERLILATRHDGKVLSADEALLVSIDLTTLGKPPDDYAAYASAIRREYGWVPDHDFAAGRAKVLKTFLDCATIYPVGWFQDRYEAQARENLTWELASIAK